MTTNSEQTTQDSEWSQCESGEIGHLVGRMQANRRHRQLRTISTVGSAMVVVLVAALMFMKPPQNHVGGISCKDVISQAEEYLADRIKASLRDQIDIHLAGCEKCRDHIEGMQVQSDTGTPTGEIPVVSHAPISRDPNDTDDFSVHSSSLISLR